MEQSIIYVYYADVGERRSPCGGESHSIHRIVKDIVEIEGGRRGVVRYGSKDIFVYQREGHLGADIWHTNQRCLGPIKVTYAYGGAR